MKKFVALLLIGLLVLPTMALAEKVKVRWFVGLGTGSRDEQIKPQQQLVDEFNKSQNDVELVLEIVANAQAFDVLATQIAAGNAPDIVGPVGIRGRDSFAGAWLDVAPLIKKANYDMSDFDDAAVKFLQVSGEQLGIPFGIYPSFLFVNKDLFDEAGLKYPPQKFGEKYEGKDWDMDALKALALKLTVDKNGADATDPKFDKENITQFGFGAQWTDARGFATFFAPGSFVGKDGKAQIPDAWKEAWAWFQDAMWKSYFHPNGANGNSDYMGQGNWFQTGHIAMDFVHMWYAGCCMGEFKGNWDTAVVPSYKGKPTAKMHADTFEIAKTTKNPDAAFKVLAFLTGKDAAKTLLPLYGAMPARKSMQADYFKTFNEQKFPGKKINWQVVVDSIAYADNPNHESWMPSFTEANNKYNEFWTKITNDGTADLKAEMDKLQGDLQKIFDAAKK